MLNETNISGEFEKVSMNYERICQLLPHRPPFILVDRVVECDFKKMHIKAIKCVSALDPYFAGHFPDNPVFPGVYMIEGLAQTSALLCFEFFDRLKVNYDRKCYLTSVTEAKFRQPVYPGDVIEFSCSIEKNRGNFVWFKGEAKVENKVVAEASFSSVLSGPVPEIVKSRMS
jgi:3-hydroxyacyl-[acyl-carrier-protein] dehydratase